MPTLLGLPVPPWPWYTYAVLTGLSLLALALAWVACRILLQALYRGLVTLVIAPLFAWSEPYTGIRWSSFGAAHWARKFELKRAGLFREAGLPLGVWQGRTLHEPTGGHICLIGPPRSRKSWGLVMPAIQTYRGSVVVSDLRGELHDRTLEARAALGPVWRYDPGGKDSCHLNVLDAVRWGTEFEYGDVHRICHHLVYPMGTEQGTPFQGPAVPLLVATCLHCHHAGEASFPAVLAWMTSPDQTMEAKLKELLASAHPLVQAGARRTLDQSERLRASVWNAALEPLSVFGDPLVSQHSRTSDVTLAELQDGIQPVSIFLCMGFHEIARLGPVIGCIVEALLAQIGSTRTPARHQVLVALDECANVGRVEGLERGLSFLQGSGAQCLLTFQNVTQVMQTYGPKSPLLASCSTKVYYTCNDVLTAQAVSLHGGETTVLGASIGETWSRSEAQRPLVTVDAALRLPVDEAIIFVQGAPAIRATKLGAPPPATRPGKVLAVARRSRPVLVPALVGLFLAVTLWPLTRTTRPRITGNVAATPQAEPPQLTAPSGNWKLLSLEKDLQSRLYEQVHGSYPSQQACADALERTYAGLIHMLQNAGGPGRVEVQQEPGRWQWSTSLPGQPPQPHKAWCVEREP